MDFLWFFDDFLDFQKFTKHHQVISTPKTLVKLAWNHLTVFWLNFEKNRRFFLYGPSPSYKWPVMKPVERTHASRSYWIRFKANQAFYWVRVWQTWPSEWGQSTRGVEKGPGATHFWRGCVKSWRKIELEMGRNYKSKITKPISEHIWDKLWYSCNPLIDPR